MADFTLVQLHYFCLVAETGSFSGAAAAEHVSATAVAAAVTALERAVGAQLCVRRRSHGVRLTTTGQLLHAEARRLLASTEELRLLIAGGGEELVGPLTVGCYSTFAPTVLPGLLEEFERRHPRVTLDLSVQSQEVLLDELHDGRLDCVLLYDLYLPDGLQKQPLYQALIHVLMSAEHRLADRDSVSLDELEDDPLILFESTPSSPHTYRVLERLGLTPHIRHRTTEYELVRSLVARDLGYSLMIHRNPAKFSYEGRRLIEMPIEPALPPETMVAVWPAGVRLNPRARELIRIAREVVTAQQPPVAAS